VTPWCRTGRSIRTHSGIAPRSVLVAANNPDAGDVIPGSGGCRKVRWSRAGSGKRGGVRVIYFTRLSAGEIWLLLIYAKAARDNIGHLLKAVREEIEDG
jgi:hypothetical protein